VKIYRCLVEVEIDLKDESSDVPTPDDVTSIVKYSVADLEIPWRLRAVTALPRRWDVIDTGTSLLPNGTYLVRVDRVENRMTSYDDTPFTRLRLVVADGEWAGRVLWFNVVWHPNVVWRILPAGFDVEPTTAAEAGRALSGRLVRARVALRDRYVDDDLPRRYNDVRQLLPRDEG